jgi:hypothetical protein
MQFSLAFRVSCSALVLGEWTRGASSRQQGAVSTLAEQLHRRITTRSIFQLRSSAFISRRESQTGFARATAPAQSSASQPSWRGYGQERPDDGRSTAPCLERAASTRVLDDAACVREWRVPRHRRSHVPRGSHPIHEPAKSWLTPEWQRHLHRLFFSGFESNLLGQHYIASGEATLGYEAPTAEWRL